MQAHMKRTKIKALLASSQFDTTVVVKGWVRTKREGKKYSFLEINDGSTVATLQVLIDNSAISPDLIKPITTGSSVSITGLLVASNGKEQTHELHAQSIQIYGLAPAEDYPLQKKAHSLEFLREIAHLRPRTNTFGCVLRLRAGLAFAVHQYFHQKGFFYVQTPIITGSDAEGAGEMFQVTTFDLLNVPRQPEGDIDFEQDFFACPTHLTVSGQLEAELVATGLAEVYTFGPTFRAENSNTTRHLAEFWMIEPEMAFYELEDNMELATDFLQYLVRFALENHRADLEFLQNTYDAGLTERLEGVVNSQFVRLTYTEAIEVLTKAPKTFEFPVQWGIDLQSEHERYLVEEHFNGPVIVFDYPKGIKAFYMRLNDDNKTVRAMDILFPGIGEIVGGSQREERLDVLLGRIRDMQLPEEHYDWYLDTRRYGTVPHSGFGLGFERLLLFVSGMSNIRDVIPFPRTPGNAAF
jgi:asparaginyl-tRNA synthetase